MENVTPLRLGVFGAVWCAGGIAWFSFWAAYVRIPDSPAITIDQEAPILPRIVVLLGVLMVLASLAWAVMTRLQRLQRKRTRPQE
jgi:hypothetical protein